MIIILISYELFTQYYSQWMPSTYLKKYNHLLNWIVKLIFNSCYTWRYVKNYLPARFRWSKFNIVSSIIHILDSRLNLITGFDVSDCRIDGVTATRPNDTVVIDSRKNRCTFEAGHAVPYEMMKQIFDRDETNFIT